MATYSKIEHSLYDNPKIVGLSCEAFRAYVEGILYSGKNLTDGFLDERIVARMWGTQVAEELTTNDPVNPSWQRVEGGWMIYGFAERQNTKADIDAKREQKRAAANARWKQKQSTSNAEPMHSAYKSDAQAMPDTDTDTDTDNKELMFNKVERKDEYSDDFETWWKSYPRKQAKGDAWKAWKSVKKHLPDIETLVATSIAYEKTVTDPQFLKMPGPWLRARRWEDAALQPKQDTYNGYAPGVVTRGEAPEGRRYAADIIEDWNE